MFIRTKSTPNSPRQSVQIVENVREGNRVKQKIIRHVGVAMDNDELLKLTELAHYIKSKLENEHNPALFLPEELAELAIAARKKNVTSIEPLRVDLKQLKEEQRTIIGIHEVYGKLYEELGFSNLFSSATRHYHQAELLRHIVMARIANPVSKRSSVMMLERDFGIHLNLPKVYRMMDKIDASMITRLQNSAYYATKQLVGGEIDVLFYDATTLYFESFTEDELKQNGYSKDFKFNQPQVILALLVTQQGLPVGYETFPGSCFEGHTLIPVLKKLRDRYAIKNVIFVADRGMLSENNLQFLEEGNFQYIVGARIRNSTKTLKEKILDASHYMSSQEDSDTRFATFEQDNGRRLIVSHSVKRAHKDQHDREKSIEKLINKLQKSKDPKALISNYGYKKYLTLEGSANVTINHTKLIEEAKWDGLHGVITNIPDMAAQEVLAHYRSLWQVEESFRISKHDLKIRPIFHWVPPRIQAHLAIAFMAFTCVRHLEYRVALQYRKLSPEVIRRELVHVQLSFLKHKQSGSRYCIPSKISQDVKKIYQVMGIPLVSTPFKLENQE
jgi:transposase